MRNQLWLCAGDYVHRGDAPCPRCVSINSAEALEVLRKERDRAIVTARVDYSAKRRELDI